MIRNLIPLLLVIQTLFTAACSLPTGIFKRPDGEPLETRDNYPAESEENNPPSPSAPDIQWDAAIGYWEEAGFREGVYKLSLDFENVSDYTVELDGTDRLVLAYGAHNVQDDNRRIHILRESSETEGGDIAFNPVGTLSSSCQYSDFSMSPDENGQIWLAGKHLVSGNSSDTVFLTGIGESTLTTTTLKIPGGFNTGTPVLCQENGGTPLLFVAQDTQTDVSSRSELYSSRLIGGVWENPSGKMTIGVYDPGSGGYIRPSHKWGPFAFYTDGLPRLFYNMDSLDLGLAPAFALLFPFQQGTSLSTETVIAESFFTSLPYSEGSWIFETDSQGGTWALFKPHEATLAGKIYLCYFRDIQQVPESSYTIEDAYTIPEEPFSLQMDLKMIGNRPVIAYTCKENDEWEMEEFSVKVVTIGSEGLMPVGDIVEYSENGQFSPRLIVDWSDSSELEGIYMVTRKHCSTESPENKLSMWKYRTSPRPAGPMEQNP